MDTPAEPPASVRERLAEPAHLFVSLGGSAGALTAERKVNGTWQGGVVELGIENGEIIVSSDARDALTLEGFQVAFEPIQIPAGTFGNQNAQLTHVRIDLQNELRTPAVWTNDNEVHLDALLDIELSWTLSLDGAPTPLGSPKLPPVPVELVLTGDGEVVNAELRAHAPGELWNWAGLIKLSELELTLDATL